MCDCRHRCCSGARITELATLLSKEFNIRTGYPVRPAGFAHEVIQPSGSVTELAHYCCWARCHHRTADGRLAARGKRQDPGTAPGSLETGKLPFSLSR